ncbi:non-ribosomal peptide synthetase [Kineosporia rhizophila]|uniref:non-ribosomal peptide synthetase n=1 Tax=Kineosporia rhizophila TaxID=84633 RepID=UPI001E54DEDC|nr:non-ribosomal peptide synthetase [Kineosporia rhizophila]MCE0536280.1 non-ribosomal peptide synthetase [Kineosporia rhizophila]
MEQTRQSTTDGYSRQICSAEWIYVGMGVPNVVQHVFEGEGELAVADLERAVATAADFSPGVRLRRKRRRWIDSGITPPVRVLPLEPGADLLADPALQTPLNYRRRGPTCEVLLVPAVGDEPTRLVFRGFHGITDARGLLLWAGDVFRVLRGEQPLGATSTWNVDELIDQLPTNGLPQLPTPKDKPEWPSLMAPLTGRRPGLIWRRRSIDGLHAAATAKVIAAIAAAHGHAEGRFLIPVDLRRHLPALRSTAWLSQALVVPTAPGAGWQDVHQELLQGLAELRDIRVRTNPKLTRVPVSIVRLLSDGVAADAARKQRYFGTAFVTNLGLVDLAEFSSEAFRATNLYSLGGSGPSSPPTVDLVETAGRTEVVITWRDVPGAAEAMDALLDVIEEALSPRHLRDHPANRTTVQESGSPASKSSLLQLFRDQVEQTPNAIALSGPDGEVSYRELSERADAIAATLRGRGVAPGEVVGVLAERTPAAIAGIWGILRAGAAYLPLDIQHPDGRVADLLTDAEARFCLVQAPHDARPCFPEHCTPVDLDAEHQADGKPDPEPAPGDLAYVIYTSGSTGRPKGVQIEHGPLLNYLFWGNQEFGIDATTRLPLLTSLSFDVSGTSIFGPLITGGTVVLVRDQPTHLTLQRLLMESGATMLNLTPSHLELIGRLDVRPGGFRSIVVVGEQLRVEVAARAQEMFGPQCRIINEYGPTEATIGITAYTFDPVADAERNVVPIGVPAHNSQVHLLDAHRRFVPDGEVGELYLAGAQLARGYLGRPDLDEERFPTLVDGTRVYRTGDVGVRRPDGILEFHGRIDDQVKIRGHRVEPAEVAATLEEHPGVDRAVVVARARSAGSAKALYGYVLVNSPVTVAELEALAAEQLPSYMVPAAVFVVDEIPYSISGKVDVKALPDPFEGGPAPEAGTGAVDATEAQIVAIWSQVLGISPSGIDTHTDFHVLGGDSLSLLTMLAAVCRDVLGSPELEAPFMAQLVNIIVRPTVANVARIARQTMGLPEDLAMKADYPG